MSAPRKRFIVDAMNVIGSRPDGWWRDRPRAVRELVEDVRQLDEPVIVVFDGRPVEIEQAQESDRVEVDRIEVLFASRRGPNAADDDIAALVAAAEDPAALCVVTSDAELAERVRASGAEVMGARAFRERLESR